MFEFIKNLLAYFFPKPQIITMPTDPESTPVEPVVPVLTANERLYEAAVASLGHDASPDDQAPDEYACMESVDDVYFKAFGKYINQSTDLKTVSTYQGYKIMKASPHFKEVTVAQPGTICVSPSGLGNGALPNGHIAIFAKDLFTLMSNNSSNGNFDMHLNLAAWIKRYRDFGGYPIFYFDLIG